MFLVHIFEKPFAGTISFHKKENCPGVFSMYVCIQRIVYYGDVSTF